MKAHFSHVHWGRVLLTDLLVIILVVILNTVLLLLASYIWSPRTLMVLLVTSWSTSILAILLTVGAGVWVARKAEREAPLHGFLVGLIAALIFFIFNPPLTDFFQGAYRGRLDLLVVALGTFFLMIAAGWLGGVLGSRGREKS
ncbi:MAG: hypothetical protein ACJ788_15230 [Ktedonobacteraceae bacterium]